MICLNIEVLEELHHVCTRQVPWHKKASVFTRLWTLGLIAPAQQRPASASGRASVKIAVLSELGKAEFERLKRLEAGSDWAEVGASQYIPVMNES